jgi:hypothetical protein
MQKSLNVNQSAGEIPAGKINARLLLYGAFLPTYGLALSVLFIALAGVPFVAQNAVLALLTLLLPMTLTLLPAIYIDVAIRYHPDMKAARVKASHDYARRMLLKERRSRNMKADEVNALLEKERQNIDKLFGQIGLVVEMLALAVTFFYALAIGLLARIASINVLIAIGIVFTITLIALFYWQYKRSGGSLRNFINRLMNQSRLLQRY